MIQVFADYFQMTSLSPLESMIPPKHIYFFKSLFSQWCMVQFWSSVSEAKLYLSEELGQRVPFLVSKRKKYISCLLTCFRLNSDVHKQEHHIHVGLISFMWSGMGGWKRFAWLFCILATSLTSTCFEYKTCMGSYERPWCPKATRCVWSTCPFSPLYSEYHTFYYAQHSQPGNMKEDIYTITHVVSASKVFLSSGFMPWYCAVSKSSLYIFEQQGPLITWPYRVIYSNGCHQTWKWAMKDQTSGNQLRFESWLTATTIHPHLKYFRAQTPFIWKGSPTWRSVHHVCSNMGCVMAKSDRVPKRARVM